MTSNDLAQRFGQRLAFLRLEKKLTQEQLAEAAAISLDFLSLMERGRRAPSFATLERLSDALGIEEKSFFEFDVHISDTSCNGAPRNGD